MKSISSLYQVHSGEDIWVIAAGSSMDYVPEDFFDNKLSIGVNQTFYKYCCDYVIIKDLLDEPRFSDSVNDLQQRGIPLIYSRYHRGGVDSPPRMKYKLNTTTYENSYVFDHAMHTEHENVHAENIGTLDKFFCKGTTITCAVNLAGHMGAKNIIICGNDGGTLDDNIYYKNYMMYERHSGGESYFHKPKKLKQHVLDMMPLVKKHVQQQYGCSVMSLNPFLDYSLEGHKYTKSTGI